MIPIALTLEPDNFDEKVRKKGMKFLKGNPNPSTKQWKTHAYWLEVKDEIRSAFRNVCAYSCHWVSEDTGWATCEHYLDKKTHPDKAYEWENYRFVCGILNGRKQNSGILDPCSLKGGEFIIDFPALLVKPSQELEGADFDLAMKTIDVLGLNDESTCLRNRQRYIMEYSNNCINADFLERHAPFIYQELIRQNLLEEIKPLMLLGQVEPVHCQNL